MKHIFILSALFLLALPSSAFAKTTILPPETCAVYLNTPRTTEVRVQKNDQKWTKWRKVSSLGDEPMILGKNLQKIEWSGGELKLETEKCQKTTKTLRKKLLTSLKNIVASLGSSSRIIPRAEWGADETLRWDDPDLPTLGGVKEPDAIADATIVRTKYSENGQKLRWPLQYVDKVSKLVIHHSATATDDIDPASKVRGIYKYHAVHNGWGDIGYNYIIDQFGTIYEGRAGGDFVVGGHARGFNIGSAGILIIGNYEKNIPTQASQKALAVLLTTLSQKYKIKIGEFSEFRGQLRANLLSHRDLNFTSCPGKNLVVVVNNLRQSVKAGVQIGQKRFEYQKLDLACQISVVNDLLQPNEVGNIAVQMKNCGSSTWNPKTYLASRYAWRNPDATPQNAANRAGNIANLKKNITPGEIATFYIPIRAGQKPGIYTFDARLIVDATRDTGDLFTVPIRIAFGRQDFEIIDKPNELRGLEKSEIDFEIKLKNTSNVVWTKNLISLAARENDARQRFAEPLHAGTLVENEVQPNQIGTFKIKAKFPKSDTKHHESWFTLNVADGEQILDEKIFPVQLIGEKIKFDAKIEPLELHKNTPAKAKVLVLVRVQNKSNYAWHSKKVGMKMIPEWPFERARMEPEIVNPGEFANFKVVVTIPDQKVNSKMLFWTDGGSGRVKEVNFQIGNTNITNDAHVE